jgi:short-subunit dehydrogenase
MRFFEGCTALITGASAGLGAEFARQLAPFATTLVLVARRSDRLEALRHELESRHPALTVRVYVADLADHTRVTALVRWLEDEKIRVNFLVNNAGLGDKGPFATADWPRVRTILDVNISALTQLTYLLLPALREGGRGAVLNVGSIAGLIPVPYMAVYGATKAYVNSFSEALRIELRDTGVTVTALLPGPAETEFGEVARRRDDNPAWDAPHELEVSVADVVRAGLVAVARDRARVIPGWKVALLMGVAATLPLCLLRIILQRRRG